MTNPTITIHNFTGPIRTSGAVYGIIVDPEDRDVRDWSHVGAGVPSEVWHRRAILFPVSASAHPASLQAAVEENLDLIEEIISTYRGPVWDGNNHVGEWQEDADDPTMRVCEGAEHALQQELDAVPQVVDLEEWYGNSGLGLVDLLDLGVVNENEQQTLSSAALCLISDARDEGVLFRGTEEEQQEEMEQYLLRLVTEELEELEEEEEEDLSADDVAWRFQLRCLWAIAQAA
tara:strand:- start:23 stop:718 length:696 start_codon:yes stop_codon:yes gene_type:complete